MSALQAEEIVTDMYLLVLSARKYVCFWICIKIWSGPF